jgi:hypothetical protein
MTEPNEEPAPFSSNEEYTKALEDTILQVNRLNMHYISTLHEICERADKMAEMLKQLNGRNHDDRTKDIIQRILKDWDSVRM